MRLLHALAGFFLYFELPIPIFWLILHPLNSFWRTRVKQAYWIATPTAWISGGILLWMFRSKLLSPNVPAVPRVIAGLLLIGVEAYLFLRVERELGSRRLVGHAELTGTGELSTSGLYAYVRHPRYAGMFCGVAGAAFLAGSKTLWLVLAIWWPFALAVIRLEEREMEVRFGDAYKVYRRQVPAFLPIRLFSSAHKSESSRE